MTDFYEQAKRALSDLPEDAPAWLRQGLAAMARRPPHPGGPTGLAPNLVGPQPISVGGDACIYYLESHYGQRPRKLHISEEALAEFARHEEEADALDQALARAVVLGGPFDPPTFTCPKCELVSHHPKDVEHRYCGACHRFFPLEG